MMRLAAVVTTLAAGALLAVGTASAGTGSAGTAWSSSTSQTGSQNPRPPNAQLTNFNCHRALDPDNRSVAVTAVMRPVTGTRHMALKFNLMMTTPGAIAPVPVHAGDLGTWKHPKNPTLGQLSGDVWNLQKSVVSLAAPATYRFRVAFRWTGSDGHVIATSVRYSARCHQPELRPDLALSSITVSALPNQPNNDLYTAEIDNDGNSGAGPFEVLFAPADGSTPKTGTVQFLPAHSSTTMSFVGPLCNSSTDPTITADSTDEVDDLNRANNAMTAPCPSP